MLKKLWKFCLLMGDATFVGIGTTIIYYGIKVSKWSLNEFETDLKKKIES